MRSVKLNDLKQDHAQLCEPLSLWLADDDRSIRNLIAEVLTRSGILRCARQFSCAEAMIETLDKETPPDVIVLDVNMGGMTGIEAISPIKSRARATHVFVMTTFYDSANEKCAIKAGASGFFVKTESPEGMVDRIRESTRARVAEPAFERSNSDCVPSLRVSAPGRSVGARNESKTSPGDSRPLILRTFGLLRDFVSRNS